ncbi:hypothetical protein [Motiliproteus sp. SC1-56]|uniref:hypothetical protein n=1 Tax=Motiliproteus sp. SC1-56 TaxID=2799565 RepID=UPI001A8E7983|nr:hypothetical protein [Motiliproteus sp. SC1-56]
MELIDLMVERVWPVARRIVLSWNDQASEIFIIDLPIDAAPRVLDVIQEMTERPVVLRMNGANLDQELPLNLSARRQLIETSNRSTVHSLRAGLDEQACCYFYFWVDAVARRIEVELVFWNDLCFPAGRPVAEHKRVLGRLLRIAHRIRGDNPQCKCILSSEYNSEPRELLNSREVAIW